MARARPPATGRASSSPRSPKGAAAKAAAPSVSDAEAQTQLDLFIDRYTPEMAALGRLAIRHMRRRLPGAVSLVYDNYNALVIGFGPEARVKTTPFSIALYPRWLNLFFLMGGRLEDPHRLLRGSGPLIRHVKIASADNLADPRLDELIAAAVLDAGWTLEPKAKNRLIIQSISPKQRPRRP